MLKATYLSADSENEKTYKYTQYTNAHTEMHSNEEY